MHRPNPSHVGLPRRVIAVSILGVVLATQPACLGCSAVGCENGVIFELSANLTNGEIYDVTACIGELCRSASLEGASANYENDLRLDTFGDTIFLSPEGETPGPQIVTLIVTDDFGSIVSEVNEQVAFELSKPNGPLCGPTCWLARVAA